MKRKLLAILLSINLLFLGCSTKSVNLDTSSAVNSSEVNTDSVAQRVFFGSLVVGVGAMMLTTLAVAILLLMPKAHGTTIDINNGSYPR